MKSCDSIQIPFHSGWLDKKSKWISQWRRRWVYLHGFDIYTFKDFEEVYSYHGTPPDKKRYFNDKIKCKATEIIHLSSQTNPVIITDSITRAFAFDIKLYPNCSNERIISFVAISQCEYQDWINKLQTVIGIIHNKKLMITKIFRDSKQQHCYYVIQRNPNFHIQNAFIFNNPRPTLETKPTAYTHHYELTVFDIHQLCAGFLRQLSLLHRESLAILNTIQTYVRFELKITNENITIFGGADYEYTSIRIVNGFVRYLWSPTITCSFECIIQNHSTFCLPKGVTKLHCEQCLQLDDKSSIKHFEYSINNALDIVCDEDMIVGSSTVVTKALNVTVSQHFCMNASALIAKKAVINVLNGNVNAVDSNIRSEKYVELNAICGNISCDRTGVLCYKGCVMFLAQKGLIKINGNDCIESNIYAFNNLHLDCYKLMLNTTYKDVFHPYLQSENTSIVITTRPNLCKFNVFTRTERKQAIDNYWWDMKQPLTWLTQPIPTFHVRNNDGDKSIGCLPKIFCHTYSYPFELSVQRINDVILNHMRQYIAPSIDADWMVQHISSYTRWDLIFGYAFERLKTLYLHSNDSYEYCNIKINKGYRIMVDQHDTNDKILNIECLGSMDIGGCIALNQSFATHLICSNSDQNRINIKVEEKIIMRNDSNISVNYHGLFSDWKHLLLTQNVDHHYVEYEGGDITISCHDFVMEENCSIDSIGHNGGNIHIKSYENIEMSHPLHGLPNVICSIGTDACGNGGDVTVECMQLKLCQDNAKANESRIGSVGRSSNGLITVKAEEIIGQIANIRADQNLTNAPARLIIY